MATMEFDYHLKVNCYPQALEQSKRSWVWLRRLQQQSQPAVGPLLKRCLAGGGLVRYTLDLPEVRAENARNTGTASLVIL